jgi:Glyoxalase-like domain/Alcohol dehydrogenase GroES-like domain
MPTDTQHSHSHEQQQMNAVVIQASGPPAQSLAYRSEPVPEPGPGEVLVEVHAAAVNPLDVANAAGLLGTPLPMIPGVDFAGIVVSDGDHTGQEVWGSGPALGIQRPGAVAGDTAVDTTGPEAGPRMILHHPPGPGTAKNSVHPVLVTDHHDEETERLTALGARPLTEIKLPPAALPPGVAAVRQTTFADPEGNEFDLVTWQPK